MTEEEAVAKVKAAANLSDERGVLYATPWLVKHSKSGTKADVSYLVVMTVASGQEILSRSLRTPHFVVDILPKFRISADVPS